MPDKKFFIPLLLIAAIISFNGCSTKSHKTTTKKITMEEKEFLNAEKLFSARKYEEAGKAYDDFIKHYPASIFIPTALLKKGLLVEPNDKDKAYILYDTIIRKFGSSDSAVEASIKASTILTEKKELKQAMDLCSLMLSKKISTRDRTRLMLIKANILFLQEKYFETMAIFSKISKTSPENYHNIRHLIARSAEKLNESQLLKAKELFDNIDAKALLQKFYAILFEKEKNFSKAKEIFNEILNEYPGTATEKEVQDELKLLESRSNIKIGCILPLSGKFAPFGQMAMKGIQLALSQFKQQTPEITIRLIIKDNESTENGSENAVEELSKEGVSGIVGPFHTAKKAAEKAQQNMIPMMIMTNRDDAKKDEDFIFRNFITPEMEAEAVINYAMSEKNIKKFAILYPDESYGKKFMNIFWDKVLSHNGKIFGLEKYNPDSPDYSEAIKKLAGAYYKELRPKENIEEGEITDTEQEAKPIQEENLQPIVDFEALFIPDGAAKAGSIIPQLAYYDSNRVMILGTSLWQSDDLIRFSEGYIETAVFPSLFSPDSSKESMNFTTSFQSVFGETPGFIEAISYDSAMFIFQAAKNAESSSPTMLREALLNSVFHGATGATSFDSTGECSKKMMLMEVHHRRIKEIR